MMNRPRHTFLATIVLLFCMPTMARPEVCKSEGEYEYTFGDGESLLEAKQHCESLAIRAAIEECALFVQSLTEVENFSMKEDLVNTIAVAFIKKKKVLESRQEGRTIFTRVSVTLDDEEMKSAIELDRARHLQSRATTSPVSPAAPASVAAGANPGLQGLYYNLVEGSTDVPTGTPIFQRVDPTIKFNWPQAPIQRVHANWFAVRWIGFLRVDTPGLYSLRFRHDDGLRVWIDNRRVYDRWSWTQDAWVSVDVAMNRTGWLPFKAEFMEKKGPASCAFQWALPGEANFEDVLSDQFSH